MKAVGQPQELALRLLREAEFAGEYRDAFLAGPSDGFVGIEIVRQFNPKEIVAIRLADLDAREVAFARIDNGRSSSSFCYISHVAVVICRIHNLWEYA